MKPLTIGQKIIGGFAALLFPATLISGVSLPTITAPRHAAHQMSDDLIPATRIAMTLDDGLMATRMASKTAAPGLKTCLEKFGAALADYQPVVGEFAQQSQALATDRAAPDLAAAAEEESAAAEEMNAQAAELNRLVGDLLVRVGGRRTPDPEGKAGQGPRRGQTPSRFRRERARHPVPLRSRPRRSRDPAPALTDRKSDFQREAVSACGSSPRYNDLQDAPRIFTPTTTRTGRWCCRGFNA